MNEKVQTSKQRALNQLDWNELDARLTKIYSLLCGGEPREIREAREVLLQAQNLRAEMAICWRAGLPLETKAKSEGLDKAIADHLMELADGSNHGTLEELQEQLLAWSMDLRSGAQSILDYAPADETGGKRPSIYAICVAYESGFGDGLYTDIEKGNPYSYGELREAYDVGKTEGARKRAVKAP